VPGDKDNRETSDKIQKGGTSRRRFLMTTLSTAVTTVAAKRAAAADIATPRYIKCPKDVQDVFTAAEQRFNQGQDLSTLLDPYVVCYPVITNLNPITCRYTVASFLQSIGGKGAHFTHIGQPQCNQNGSVYVLTGCAHWHDFDAPSGHLDPLNYEFHIQYDLITYMYAPVGNVCSGPANSPIPFSPFCWPWS
jgi:hypothetical protein